MFVWHLGIGPLLEITPPWPVAGHQWLYFKAQYTVMAAHGQGINLCSSVPLNTEGREILFKSYLERN